LAGKNHGKWAYWERCTGTRQARLKETEIFPQTKGLKIDVGKRTTHQAEGGERVVLPRGGDASGTAAIN